MAIKKSKNSAPVAKKAAYPDELYMQTSYGLLLGVLGIVWMAKEIGWLQTSIPIGPFIIIIMGLMIMFVRTRKNRN